MKNEIHHELVKSFQSGSRDAFAKLVSQYQNLVASVAYANTGDVHRSEDIAQQTFLVAWQKQTELKDPGKFGAWLRGIANNLSRNERRLKENVQQRASVAISESSQPSSSNEVDSPAIQKEQSELLWSTLNRIPIEYREPLILFYREEKSVAAVAEQLELSEDNIKQRLKRGRAMMKEEVENLVEEFLIDTRPSSRFSAGVIAMLPTAATIASTTAKVASVAAAKTVGGKAATAVAAGTAAGKLGAFSSLGFFAAIAGPFLGVAGGLIGGWFGARSGAKDATSEEEKKLHWHLFYFMTFIAVAVSVAVIVLLANVPRNDPNGSSYVRVVVGLYLFFLLSSLALYNFKLGRLHRKHGFPKSMQENARRFQLVGLNAFRLNTIGALVGGWAWLVGGSFYYGSLWYGLFTLAVVFVHFYVIWKRAPNATTPAMQKRQVSAACFWTLPLQFLVVTIGIMFSQFSLSDTLQGVPNWTMCIAVPVLTLWAAWLVELKAKEAEEDAVYIEQFKSSD